MMRDYEVVLFTLRKTAMKQSFFFLVGVGGVVQHHWFVFLYTIFINAATM